MRFSTGPSWQIRVGQWTDVFAYALWARAAERIAAPAGGVVPGPLDIDPQPTPTVDHDGHLVDDWLGWWHALYHFRDRT